MIRIEYTKKLTPDCDYDYSADDCWTTEDLKRIESGDLYFIGVQAEATIMSIGQYGTTMYTIKSSGLWGIQSGAPEYEEEVYQEQVQELKQLFEDIKSSPDINHTLTQ